MRTAVAAVKSAAKKPVCTIIKSILDSMVKYNHCSERFTIVVIDKYIFVDVYFPQTTNDDDLCISETMIAEIKSVFCIVSRLTNCICW